MTLRNSALIILLGLVYSQEQADDFPPEIETYADNEVEESGSNASDNPRYSKKKSESSAGDNNDHKYSNLAKLHV